MKSGDLKHSGTTVLVKLGGSILENFSEAHWICKDFASLLAGGVKVVVVHGGGPNINAELVSRGITWEFIEGQRVTTPEIMNVIELVLAGTVNGQIVRGLNLSGTGAVGMSGIDGFTLLCKRASEALGQVGVIEEVEASLMQGILNATSKDGKAFIPVIAPIGVGLDKQTFNVNADWAASRIAQALGIKKLIFLTDQDGIKGPENTVLREIDQKGLEHLVETAVVKGGMLVKTRTILSALAGGIESVHIINGRRKNAILDEMSGHGVGTVCRKSL